MYALASCEGFGEGGRLNRGAVLGSAGEVLAADVSAHHVGAGNADAAKLMVANDSLHIPRGDIWRGGAWSGGDKEESSGESCSGTARTGAHLRQRQSVEHLVDGLLQQLDVAQAVSFDIANELIPFCGFVGFHPPVGILHTCGGYQIN